MCLSACAHFGCARVQGHACHSMLVESEDTLAPAWEDWLCHCLLWVPGCLTHALWVCSCVQPISSQELCTGLLLHMGPGNLRGLDWAVSLACLSLFSCDKAWLCSPGLTRDLFFLPHGSWDYLWVLPPSAFFLSLQVMNFLFPFLLCFSGQTFQFSAKLQQKYGLPCLILISKDWNSFLPGN